MADIKAFAGSAWGVPVRGAIVGLAAADVSAILSAASGLAKGLFLVGSSLGLAAVALFALLRPKPEALPWGTLADVATWEGPLRVFGGTDYSRRFRGVCLTQEIRLDSDGHTFTIPVDYVREYHAFTTQQGVFKKRSTVDLNLTLFDNSKYRGVLLAPSQFEFLTPLGKQTIAATSQHMIHGCTVEETTKLRTNIDQFLQREATTAEGILGVANFQRFFVRG